MMRAIARRALACVLSCTLLLALLSAGAQAAGCAVPGKDGPGGTITGVVNTYYPGTQTTVGAGATSITLGSAVGAATAIAAGDLLLIMQMQGAALNATDDANYGANNGTGAGHTGTPSAGLYEYAVANNAVGLGGGTLNLQSGVTNSYANADASGSSGQYRYQVIRVPQYSSVTLSSGLTATAWNGTAGGVLVIDVAGGLTLGGNVNVSALGFRGGGARQSGSGSGANTIYRVAATNGAHGSKGEGIVGTPRFVWNGTAVLDNTTEGYPNGSFGRGAPGNAGGGGNDGNPATNDQNAGGGGGGNGGVGNQGGNSWNSNLPVGGLGGASLLSLSPTRIFMGGGGGAGSRNNSTGTQSSGGRGGGIVFIRAGAVSGTGTISADGETPPAPANDGAGGGGAGGTVVVQVASGNLNGLTINARGAKGADSWPTEPPGGYPGSRHGPGGGGGGGVALTNVAAGTVDVSNGVNGTASTAADPYGAVAGTQGITNNAYSNTEAMGAACTPQLTVAKQTVSTGPLTTAVGTNVTYRITVTNAAGRGTAMSVSLSDALPGSPNAFTNESATPTITLNGGATRPSTSNAAVGATTPVWSSFQIPGGASVVLTFTVHVPANTTPGTYQNTASAIYQDPARVGGGGTATVNSNPAATTDEDVIVTGPTLGTPLGAGCAAGTFESGVNLITNGNFAAGSTGFTAGVSIAASDTYPANTSVAVQNGEKYYQSGATAQSTFPGDGVYGVAPASSWLFANGNNTGGRPYTLWQQTISGLTSGATYTFFMYVSNATKPGGTLATPALQLWQGSTQIPTTFSIANESTTTGDVWTRVQWTFTAAAASITLSVRDNVASSGAGPGDEYAITQLSLHGCQSRTVSGFVYRDANNNGTRDGGESWPGGTTVNVKLAPRSGATCGTSTTPQTVSTAGTGAYAFTNVAPGEYCLIIDTNATTTDMTPNAPAGWLPTAPSTMRWDITVGIGGPALNFDFGLINSRVVSGRAFRDTGVGGGIANNGIQDGAEAGIGGVQITLTDCGATTYATTLTDAAGDYEFAVPTAATLLCVRERNDGDDVSTGANVSGTALPSGVATSVGGISYTYNRATDSLQFTLGATVSAYPGLNFADVPDNSFAPGNSQVAAPGTIVFHPHTFIAGTGGSVSFATTAIATPNISGWGETIYRDSNCNGQFDAGEPLLGAPVVMTAGQQLCILMREFTPANAGYGARNVVTVTATFTYTNAAPVFTRDQARVDATTVSSTELQLIKSADRTTALPGQTITYTITYGNNAATPVSDVVIRDATPPFTQFQSASCGGLGAGVTACAVTAQPVLNTAGAIVWTLTGSLVPGGTGTVSFVVRVEQ